MEKQLFFPVPMNSNECLVRAWKQQRDGQDVTSKGLFLFRLYKHTALQLDTALDGGEMRKCHKKSIVPALKNAIQMCKERLKNTEITSTLPVENWNTVEVRQLCGAQGS